LITSDAEYTLQALNGKDYDEWLNAIQVWTVCVKLCLLFAFSK